MLVVIFLVTTFQKQKAINIKAKVNNDSHDEQYNIYRFSRNELANDKTCNNYIRCLSFMNNRGCLSLLYFN